jgi:hypothetical protein
MIKIHLKGIFMWMGHVAYMGEISIAHIIVVGKPV